LRRFSAKGVADDATTMQCRIGINTGEVVVGSIQTGAGPEGPAAQAAAETEGRAQNRRVELVPQGQ
jgi:class 3 adenylate cyclase